MIELGSFLFAISIGLFILPGKVLTGGVAGIVSLLSAYVSFDEDIMVIIINTVLFIIGSLLLGKEFFFNTLLYSISYPLMLLFVTRRMPAVSIDPLLASLYGGFLGGVAIGIMFRNGGSSGGVDVIALALEKYFHIKVNHTIMAVDAITVLAGLYTYGLNAVLIGLMSVFMMSVAIERTLDFYKTGISAKKFEIISERYKEISDDINNSDIDRGTSFIEIEGGYTGSRRTMLMVVASEDQVEDINAIIRRHDPKAFVIISDTREVNGEGFTYMVRM